MNFETMRRRSEIHRKIRSFFQTRDYLEVETPLLAPALIPETPIEVFETSFLHDFQGNRQLYLIPSPEVFMKKLIAAGSGDIFQLTKSFRNGEQVGPHHNPEFTMLEWYTVGADYRGSIETTEALFEALLEEDSPEYLRPPFRHMSVREAFLEFSGIDLEKTPTAGVLLAESEKRGLLTLPSGQNPTWEELFHRIFLTHVEPRLPKERPLILLDYPVQIPCLARRIPGSPWRERWELYVKGVEIANCYSEETDPRRVEDFFRSETARTASSHRVIPDSDTDFTRIFHEGFPDCSGVALGIDRLVMSFLQQKSMAGVIFFPISDSVQS